MGFISVEVEAAQESRSKGASPGLLVAAAAASLT